MLVQDERTLHDPRHLMILVKIQQLLIHSERRRPMRRVSFATERDASEVETEEENGGRGGVAGAGAILAVVPCVVCESSDLVWLEFCFWGTHCGEVMNRVRRRKERERKMERTAQV